MPSYRRALRNAYEDNKLVNRDVSRHLVFVQPHWRPHDDVAHCLVQLPFDLPDDAYIRDEIAATAQGTSSHGDADGVECPPELAAELVDALRGLDAGNMTKALTKCVVEFGGLVPVKVFDGQPRRLSAAVRAARSRLLSASQGVTLFDPESPEIAELGELAGYENVRKMADDVLFCLSGKVPPGLRLKTPNGFGVAGPPGTGKTACAKLFARWLGWPLVVVDMGRMKNKWVGDSEANMAITLAMIRALGQVVVLVDEFDKQSTGLVGEGTTDTTGAGMLSQLLQFAGDQTRKAFLIFAMNRLTGPIESLRAGRLNCVFFTPMPDDDTRLEIIRLKLQAAGAKAAKDVLETAVEKTTGLTGAEIEQLVQAATLLAARGGRDAVQATDLADARLRITPVAQMKPAEVAAMTEFEKFAVPVGPAGRPRAPAAGGSARRSRRRKPDRAHEDRRGRRSPGGLGG
jgi:hypothetical protein